MLKNRFSEKQQAYLQALGVTVWEQRSAAGQQQQTPEHIITRQHRRDLHPSDWETLQNEAASCQRCNLSNHRTHVVFGAGDPRARWMLVGEAPGAQEDKEGLPFVGRAGQLLTAMLMAMGLSRQEVYIANVLKCRPPGNRDPLGEESRQCLPYLYRQLELLRPVIILAMGRFAAQALLKTSEPIGQLRGRQHRFEATGTPLVVTYHPAYLLRSPLEKRKVWLDLQFALSIEEKLQ